VANIARKLQAEGLTDPGRKRQLPPLPEQIGLVTSPRSAAVHDVLRTLRRRFPVARVLVAGVPVEGATAAAGIIEGLRCVVASGAQVVLVVRGGGSFEDLMPFNDEALARTVAASRLPIISAVGHESDVSICDFVADLRAPTPSAAAEAAVPDAEELKQILTQKYARLQHATSAKLQRLRNTLSAKESNRMLRSPQELFDVRRMHLIMREERLQHLTDKGLARKRGAFVTAAARLEGLSPLSVLTRGYAMVTDEAQRTLTGAEQLSVGQHVRLHFSNGEADAVVEDVTTAKNNSRKDA
jgi:exodeoxyribonuclease VII large subunit